MWFQILALIIATALIVKGLVALAIPNRFYAARQRQYDSETMPRKLLVPPVIVLTLTAVAWYATLAHYRPWGFIVTGALTLLSGMAVHNLRHWSKHRRAMHALVRDPKVWRIDAGLLVAGLGFTLLALLVY